MQPNAQETPNDLVAAGTAEFVLAHLPPGAGRRVLDVGCGDGLVAALLAAAGCDVVGIDVDAERVAKARTRGVDARLCDVMQAGLDEGPYDAVVFGWSLHHVGEPAQALDHVRGLLRPGGRIVVLEMAFDEVDDPTRAWAGATEALLVAAGMLKEAGRAWFVKKRQGHDHDHDDAHTHRHDHDFTPSRDLRALIAERFRLLHEERGAAIHAFWSTGLPNDRAEVAARLLDLERLAIEAGAIVPLAVRLVAAPH